MKMNLAPEFNQKRRRSDVWIECYSNSYIGKVIPTNEGPVFELDAEIIGFQKNDLKSYSGTSQNTLVTLQDGQEVQIDIPVQEFGKELRRNHKTGLMDLKSYDLKSDLMRKPWSLTEIRALQKNSLRKRESNVVIRLSLSNGGVHNVNTSEYAMESQKSSEWGNYKVVHAGKSGKNKSWCIAVVRKDEFEQFETIANALKIKVLDMTLYNRAQYAYWHTHGRMPPQYKPLSENVPEQEKQSAKKIEQKSTETLKKMHTIPKGSIITL